MAVRRRKLRRFWKWLHGRRRLWEKKRICWEMICFHVCHLKTARTPAAMAMLILMGNQKEATLRVSGKGYAKQKLKEKRLNNLRHGYPPFLRTHWHQGNLWPDFPPPPPEVVDKITGAMK